MSDIPELWWSPSLADGGLVGDAFEPPDEYATPAESGLIQVVNGTPLLERYATSWWPLPALPDDAIPLVPAEPVDAKGRGPSYLRGFADGQMAARAALKAAGLTDAETFSLEAYFAIDNAVRADDDQAPSG